MAGDTQMEIVQQCVSADIKSEFLLHNIDEKFDNVTTLETKWKRKTRGTKGIVNCI